MPEDKAIFDSIFEEQCKGKESCQFKFRQNQLPITSCFLPHASPSNWQYGLVAYCASKSVKWGENEIDVTKNLIGIVVVVFDLLITFGFWCSMLAFKKL